MVEARALLPLMVRHQGGPEAARTALLFDALERAVGEGEVAFVARLPPRRHPHRRRARTGRVAQGAGGPLF